MEELDLKELLDLFWSKITYIIVFTILAAGIGVIYTFYFTVPKYSSTTSLLLTSTGATSGADQSANTITTTDITLNSKLVSTYSELVKSKKLLRQVLANLNIDVSEENLKRNVSVKLKKDTEMLEITVTNEDPTYAAKMANEIAKVFPDMVTDVFNINNINIVDEAEVPSGPSNINHSKDIVIAAFIGFAIAIAYILLVNMLDNTIKTAEDVEKGYGLPVLVSIPLIDNFNLDKGGKKK